MPGMVGQFPSMREMMRRTVRGPDNPLDKSTVVSIYPKPIMFKNVTLTPGRWRIEAGSYENPALMIVGPSSWWKDVAIDEPLIEIVQSSVQIAESLVKDWMNGLFACNMQDAMPGLFFIPGKFTQDKIKTDWGGLLSNADQYQKNYYASLIKYAEALWARSNGNPLAVNDEMRLAARSLGRQDVDWMKQEVNTGMKPCFACGEFKNPAYPICKSCGTIDPDHPMASKIVKGDTQNPFGKLERK